MHITVTLLIISIAHSKHIDAPQQLSPPLTSPSK